MICGLFCFVCPFVYIDGYACGYAWVSVIYVVVISFRNEESVGIPNCLNKVFVCLMNICAPGSAGDEILNLLFK